MTDNTMGRDLGAVDEVGLRAQLGWFDKEFRYYGTAYLQNGEEHYLISGNAMRLYDFVEDQLENGVFCTPVETYARRCPVPSGAEDYMARDFKLQLGKRMQALYPEEFLTDFQCAFSDVASDAAEPLLSWWRESIDGLFESEYLDLFELLLHQAASAKLLKPLTRYRFRQWLDDVRGDMSEDLVVKNNCRQDFYSLSYVDGGKRKRNINAQKDQLYLLTGKLLKRGIRPSPIQGKTYWFSRSDRPVTARRSYESWLQSPLMEFFIDQAEAINRLAPAIDAERYEEKRMEWLNEYGRQIDGFLGYYKMRWTGEMLQ